MTLDNNQKHSILGRLQVLITETVDLAGDSKNLSKIFEALYKLKYRFQHETEVQQIAPTTLDRKAIREELSSLINK